MKRREFSYGILVAGVLIVVQYFLAFFVFNLPGIPALHWIGWGIWVLSLVFGIAPVFILRNQGGVERGKSYVHTTRLVDSSLYAVVRHPQYVGGMLFNLALMLLAQHWLVLSVGVTSIILIYLDIQAADREGLQKFGEDYQNYIEKVPQVNLLVGFLRAIRRGEKAR